MDHRQVRDGSLEAILILDPVYVKKAYGYTASHYHCLQWQVGSYDGVMRALAKKKTQWKKDLSFSMTFAQQKLSKYYAEVTPTTGIRRISARNLGPFWMLQSYWKWHKGMDIYPGDKTSYTSQYHVAFLKSVENESCAKHQRMSVIKPWNVLGSNHFLSATASTLCRSSCDPYDLSSNQEQCLTPKCMADTALGFCDCAAFLLTAARLHLNSLSESSKHWGQVNPNVNENRSDPMEISSTFLLPDITDWWHKEKDMHT